VSVRTLRQESGPTRGSMGPTLFSVAAKQDTVGRPWIFVDALIIIVKRNVALLPHLPCSFSRFHFALSFVFPPLIQDDLPLCSAWQGLGLETRLVKTACFRGDSQFNLNCMFPWRQPVQLKLHVYVETAISS
jgi:hypothetical protein